MTLRQYVTLDGADVITADRMRPSFAEDPGERVRVYLDSALVVDMPVELADALADALVDALTGPTVTR
jgi:hypothetical protein